MTSAARAGASRREGWLDALRVLAAFGVIVNHTNSKVFQALTPQDAQWWLSVGWYYVSKMAVPLFVMVSGACLLPRRDSPRRVLGRMARILGALLLFSYAYYLYDAWVYWGLWPRMADLGTFLRLVWTQQITDSFWYLTFYLALLAMLPFLQRLASALSGRGVAALAGICLLWDGLWPLAAHYVPAISPPAYQPLPPKDEGIFCPRAGHPGGAAGVHMFVLTLIGFLLGERYGGSLEAGQTMAFAVLSFNSDCPGLQHAQRALPVQDWRLHQPQAELGRAAVCGAGVPGAVHPGRHRLWHGDPPRLAVPLRPGADSGALVVMELAKAVGLVKKRHGKKQ